MLKIKIPFDLKTVVQKFGANAVTLYSGMGLKGHPGIDFGIDWGTPIPNCVDGAVVSAILSKDNPNLMAFRAVNTIFDDGDTSYEIQYGHCSDMFAKVGQTPKLYSTIANVGNTGDVFAYGKEVTEQEKEGGSHAGSHLHLQVRVLKRHPSTMDLHPDYHYLNDGSGILNVNGFVYYVVDYNNGYNGCVDPSQFFESPDTVNAPKTNVVPGVSTTPGLSASDQIAVFATQKMASGNTAQANILFALARVVKSFGN